MAWEEWKLGEKLGVNSRLEQARDQNCRNLEKGQLFQSPDKAGQVCKSTPCRLVIYPCHHILCMPEAASCCVGSHRPSWEMDLSSWLHNQALGGMVSLLGLSRDVGWSPSHSSPWFQLPRKSHANGILLTGQRCQLSFRMLYASGTVPCSGLQMLP